MKSLLEPQELVPMVLVRKVFKKLQKVNFSQFMEDSQQEVLEKSWQRMKSPDTGPITKPGYYRHVNMHENEITAVQKKLYKNEA